MVTGPSPSSFPCSRLVVLWLLCSGAPAGQALADSQDVQFWTPTTIQKAVHEDWFVQVETQVRFVEELHEFQNSLLRPAAGYRLTPRLSVYAGYAWVPLFYPARRNEHRIWQQLMIAGAAGGWALQERFRFEQRFLPGVDGPSLRLRGQLRAARPISAGSQWQLVLSDEAFFHLNSVRALPAGFAINRVLVGFNHPIVKYMTVEPGYMLQYARRSAPLTSEWDHVIMLTTNVRF